MPDMEGSISSSPYHLQHETVRDFVDDGGTLIMTGTSGANDNNFLNTAFGFNIQSSSSGCSTSSLNAWNAAGTPFTAPTLDCASATDHFNCAADGCTS